MKIKLFKPAHLSHPCSNQTASPLCCPHYCQARPKASPACAKNVLVASKWQAHTTAFIIVLKLRYPRDHISRHHGLSRTPTAPVHLVLQLSVGTTWWRFWGAACIRLSHIFDDRVIVGSHLAASLYTFLHHDNGLKQRKDCLHISRKS